MIFSARPVLLPAAIGFVLTAMWSALATPSAPVSSRYSRHRRALRDERPPGWLTVLARAVLVLALVALGVASLLD